MKKDLSEGAITKTILLFAGPMILGNLLQQCYNIADTLIVGRFLGAHALAAVGSAYTLMTFLNSIIIGLCMGSGAVFSVYFGKKEEEGLRGSIGTSFGMIALVTLAINGLVFLFLDPILRVLQVPADVYDLMREYVFVIFFGIVFIFLYNYFAFLLRALWQFCGASGVSVHFCRAEYCTGSFVCDRVSDGCFRSSTCDCGVPDHIRSGNCTVYL